MLMRFGLDYTSDDIRELIEGKVQRRYGCSLQDASEPQAYNAVALSVLHILAEQRYRSIEATENAEAKQVYYLSLEYLMGRSLKNNLYNLGLEDEFEGVLSGAGIVLSSLYELEPDAALGNGGLGRLAACYLDALSSLSLPCVGYSIRYSFGLFKQKLVDGWQTELPDSWLGLGDVWLVPKPEEILEVRLGGDIREQWSDGKLNIIHEHYESILAEPFDMLIPGYEGKRVNLLRLWSAKAPSEIDMQRYSSGDYIGASEASVMAESISNILYPSDDHLEGRRLRLKQQYFLVSATVQDIIRQHLAEDRSLEALPEKAAIHINDTHPSMVIPELMRILMDNHGFPWDKAWRIVCGTVSYTNHTVLNEALECWPIDMLKEILPRIWSIIAEINERFSNSLKQIHKVGDDALNRMSIIGDNGVRMANLCLSACYCINGVSALHTRILTDDVFKDFNAIMPSKFRNVTNGIAYRRWLCQANPELTALLDELIGPGYRNDADLLKEFLRYRDDTTVLNRIRAIKHRNKAKLSTFIQMINGIAVNPESVFDVQIKRLHEYKRQLLNALHILHLYCKILDEPSADIVPRTFIFGAKASPGYYRAKQIISFISHVATLVNSEKTLKDRLKVVFVEDYNVSKAESIIPAAEISEQISLAGKEASGTGNMKLMLNGALTLGTLDGANIEILDAVGPANMVIFGMNSQEVAGLWQKGYDPGYFVSRSPELQRVIEFMRRGIAGTDFADIVDYLLVGRGQHPDPYMCLADFQSYSEAQSKIENLYLEPERWNRISLVNTAFAGRFAADRAINEYAEHIWAIKPVK